MPAHSCQSLYSTLEYKTWMPAFILRTEGESVPSSTLYDLKWCKKHRRKCTYRLTETTFSGSELQWNAEKKMTKPKSLTEFTLWSSREFLMHIDLCIPPCPYTHRKFSQSLMKQTCFRSMHGRLYNGEWISLIPGHRFLLHITPANHRMEAVRIVSHSDEDHRHHRKEGCWSTLTVLPCPKLQTWQGYYDHRHIAVYYGGGRAVAGYNRNWSFLTSSSSFPLDNF